MYFIQDAVTLAIKIGFCLKNPRKRLAALQTGNSNAMRLLGHVPGSELHERRLHERFSQFHIQGEWFGGAIQAAIEAILTCSSLDTLGPARGPDLPRPDLPGAEPATC